MKRFWLLTLLLLTPGVNSCIDLAPLKEFNSFPASQTMPPPVLDAWGAGLDDLSPADHGRYVPEIPATDIDVGALEGFVLAGLEPAQGDALGGDVIMLVGSGFHDDMELFLGETRTSDPFVVTSNFATVITPPHLPGTVDAQLVGGEGELSLLPGGFTFVADLTVEIVEPEQGPAVGGTPLIVSGTGFDSDCELFMAGRKAAFVTKIDDFTLHAVTPPGHCGSADLVVRCGAEQAQLPHAFFYQGEPRVDELHPLVGSTVGGYDVWLQGANFSPTMSVALAGQQVGPWDLHFFAPWLVAFKAPAADPGYVPLSVTNDCGQTDVGQAFLYVEPPEDDGGPMELLGVMPSTLPACAGGLATLAVKNMEPPENLQAMVTGLPAQVVAVDEDLGTVEILVPPSEPGSAEVSLGGLTTWSTIEDALLLAEGMVVESATPTSGHSGGGTSALIEGCGFPEQVEVRFGTSVASDAIVFSSSEIGVTTPPGPTGDVDVSVFGNGAMATLPAGFTYVTDEPTLYLVDPEYGAVAGGTYVRVHGASFPPNATVRFGEHEAFDLEWLSPSLITLRAPPNEAGGADVTVAWPGGESSLAQGYTYFNPKSKKGGTWGGEIDEALIVTVLDSSTGKGLAAAWVMMGSDAASPHKGVTDEDGQITFSAPGLGGKQEITAGKQGYSLYSVVHFNAENVTVYLSPIKLPGGGGSSGSSVETFVSGRVVGLDKYVSIPPGNCGYKNTGTVLCQPCDDDSQCVSAPGEDGEPGPVAWCSQVGETGTWCVTECLAPEDCPEGFVCTKTSFEKTGCLPIGGERAARCESSKKSMFGMPPNPGPGGDVNLHDIFFINSVHGELAIVCYGGYIEADTNKFIPTVMGLRRHVIALPGDILKDQDVVLDIPLVREARIAFHDVPYHPEGTRKPYLILSLELGKDGYLAPPVKPIWEEEGRYYLVPSLPAKLAGQLLGATWSIYSSVQTDTLYSIPYAVRMVTEIPSLFGDGVLQQTEAGFQQIHPPIEGDVLGLDYRNDSDVWLATNRAELLHYDGQAWTPAGVGGMHGDLSAMAPDDEGGLWLAGEAGLWHFDGLAWHHIDAGITANARDIWAVGDEAVLVVAGGLIQVNHDGVQATYPSPEGHELVAVWGADFEDLYAISAQSVLWNRTPTQWTSMATPGTHDLVDIDGSSPDDIWVAGSPGFVLRYDGDYFEFHDVDPHRPLTSIDVAEPGRAFAGGADGLLFEIENGVITKLETDSLQDLTALDYSSQEGRIMAGGIRAYNLGPFMAYPNIVSPVADEYFDFTTLKWDFWTEGAKADFHYIILSSADGYPFWFIVLDGDVLEYEMPPITQELGLKLYPDGKKRMNFTSSINPDFNIDKYTLNDFSIYRKVTWAVTLQNFK